MNITYDLLFTSLSIFNLLYRLCDILFVLCRLWERLMQIAKSGGV